MAFIRALFVTVFPEPPLDAANHTSSAPFTHSSSMPLQMLTSPASSSTSPHQPIGIGVSLKIRSVMLYLAVLACRAIRELNPSFTPPCWGMTKDPYWHNSGCTASALLSPLVVAALDTRLSLFAAMQCPRLLFGQTQRCLTLLFFISELDHTWLLTGCPLILCLPFTSLWWWTFRH